VLGRKLELLELDDLSTPIGSKHAAERAVKEGVTAILGAAWSSQTLAMAPIAQAHRIPLISNISTNDQLARAGDCIFRMCFSDSFQGQVMAQFARGALHARTAVTVSDVTSDYSTGLAREFDINFQVAGGSVLWSLSYRLNQASFTELAAQVKALHPDVVFIPGYWESAVIIKEILAQGCTAIPLGGDGWGTALFYSRGGNDIPKAYFSTHWSEELDSPKSRAFVKKYKSGPREMDPQEALAYDAVYLLADAIRRAGSSDREKVRRAIAATRDFNGVTGRISFHEPREQRNAVIMVINAGVAHYHKSVQP
jgi:branched-chain amino acid transport system substrate-binding protein